MGVTTRVPPERLGSLRPAPFAPRLFAGLLDFALICGILGALEAPLPEIPGIAYQVFGALIELAIFWGYYAFFNYRYQATPGKMLFRLRVVRSSDFSALSFWRSAIRAIIFPFSLLMGVGLLMTLFNPRRQALHDVIAGTRVVRLAG